MIFLRFVKTLKSNFEEISVYSQLRGKFVQTTKS